MNYRSPTAPDKFKVCHRKNGGIVDHPLEARILVDGEPKTALFYEEAAKIFTQVPRRHASIVSKRNGTLYGDGGLLAQEVREMADSLGMKDFTIDKARHEA